MIFLDLPPKPALWTPPKPAIIRSARDIAPHLAMPVMTTFAAASVRGHRPPKKALVETAIDRTTGTNIGNTTLFGGLAAIFDGNKSQSNGQGGAFSGNPGYCGKSYVATKKIARVKVYGTTDSGFAPGGGTPSVTLTLYVKVSGAESSGTDGTASGSATFTNTTNESSGGFGGRTIVCTNPTLDVLRYWVRCDLGGGVSVEMTEIEAWEWL